MRLLRADTKNLKLEEVPEGSQKYAILSHRWLSNDQEITFADLMRYEDGRIGLDVLQSKQGWEKLQFCKQQAKQDGLDWIWADTICIDKSSSTELSESINSMYRWYQEAEICYVYLHDMPDPDPRVSQGVDHSESFITDANATLNDMKESALTGGAFQDCQDHSETNDSAENEASIGLKARPVAKLSLEPDLGREWDHKALQRCEYFTRGWTLQELLASSSSRFYNRSWTFMGHLKDLARHVSQITGIHEGALHKTRKLQSYSIAQRMSWAAHRKTTKIEDRAYSLMGIMGVNMGVVYGEGRRAFRRLQEEIIRSSSDDSIFAFGFDRVIRGGEDSLCALFADCPEDFQFSRHVIASSQMNHRPCQLIGGEMVFTQSVIMKDNLTFFRTFINEGIRASGLGRACYLILNCYLDNDPAKLLVLPLKLLPDSTTSFGVRSGVSRLQTEDVWVRYWEKPVDRRSLKKQRLRTLGVITDPQAASTPSRNHKGSIVFRTFGKWDEGDTVNFFCLEQDSKAQWHPESQALIVSLDDAWLPVLRLDMTVTLRNRFVCPKIHLSIDPGRNVVFHIEFDSRSIFWPEWTTFLLFSWTHGSTFTYWRGHILLATSYVRLRIPERPGLFLVRLSRWHPMSFTIFALWRVVLLVASFLVYALTGLFLGWPIEGLTYIYYRLADRARPRRTGLAVFVCACLVCVIVIAIVRAS